MIGIGLYSVATEDGIAWFQTSWRAKRALKRVPLRPGQCCILAKHLRGNRVHVLDERYRPDPTRFASQ